MVTRMSLRFGIVLGSAAATVASLIASVACGSGSDGNAFADNGAGSTSGQGSTNGAGSTNAGSTGGLWLGMGGTSGGYATRDSGTGAGAPTSVDAACGAAILSPEAIKVD